jgi:hypothetical protein
MTEPRKATREQKIELRTLGVGGDYSGLTFEDAQWIIDGARGAPDPDDSTANTPHVTAPPSAPNTPLEEFEHDMKIPNENLALEQRQAELQRREEMEVQRRQEIRAYLYGGERPSWFTDEYIARRKRSNAVSPPIGEAETASSQSPEPPPQDGAKSKKQDWDDIVRERGPNVAREIYDKNVSAHQDPSRTRSSRA